MTELYETNLTDLGTIPARVQKQVRKIIEEAREQDRRTYSHYQKLREKNPKLYLDPVIAKQMDKDANDLGEAFFDND